MSDEQEDESLGVEQLPQTELDAVPGKAEKQDPNTGDIPGAGISKPNVNTSETAKLLSEKNRENND